MNESVETAFLESIDGVEQLIDKFMELRLNFDLTYAQESKISDCIIQLGFIKNAIHSVFLLSKYRKS